MARSKVTSLPKNVRERLDKALIDRGFADYTELVEWLESQGHSISRSSLHRYGSKLERKIESVRVSTEMANALVEASPDDAGAMADATLRIVQSRMFDLLMASEKGDLKEISVAARAIAEAARASTTVRMERRKARTEAAGIAEKEVKKAGLTRETAAAIRAAIEGHDPE